MIKQNCCIIIIIADKYFLSPPIFSYIKQTNKQSYKQTINIY